MMLAIIRSIRRVFVPPCAYKYVELPADIFVHLATMNPEMFSLLYRTCKEINERLRTILPQIRIKFRIPVPDQPQLWIYPNGKQGFEIHDNILAYSVYRYISDKIVYSIYRDTHNSQICFRKGNESWKWSTEENHPQLISYERGGIGDRSWYRLIYVHNTYRETRGQYHSYELGPARHQVSNYEIELEIALFLLSVRK